ncbi:hypothetical protein DO73_3534 [Burkholderia pseudomallei]|nr:hypothetical protein DO73_3534 [Burkholderia pseudomallei]KGD02150.1 hypothetical protein DO63_5161 [Burkholderia pseudomallei]KGS61353.1 hypothetical protein X990_5281 [Burkholderia pseudomallei MSHR4868]
MFIFLRAFWPIDGGAAISEGECALPELSVNRVGIFPTKGGNRLRTPGRPKAPPIKAGKTPSSGATAEVDAMRAIAARGFRIPFLPHPSHSNRRFLGFLRISSCNKG